jgi:hypothetical protein
MIQSRGERDLHQHQHDRDHRHDDGNGERDGRGPSFGYTGSTEILVYWDSIYHSFMFAYPVGEITPGRPARSRKKRGVAKAAKKPARAGRRPGA